MIKRQTVWLHDHEGRIEITAFAQDGPLRDIEIQLLATDRDRPRGRPRLAAAVVVTPDQLDDLIETLTKARADA